MNRDKQYLQHRGMVTNQALEVSSEKLAKPRSQEKQRHKAGGKEEIWRVEETKIRLGRRNSKSVDGGGDS